MSSALQNSFRLALCGTASGPFVQFCVSLNRMCDIGPQLLVVFLSSPTAFCSFVAIFATAECCGCLSGLCLCEVVHVDSKYCLQCPCLSRTWCTCLPAALLCPDLWRVPLLFFYPFHVYMLQTAFQETAYGLVLGS